MNTHKDFESAYEKSHFRRYDAYMAKYGKPYCGTNEEKSEIRLNDETK